MAKINARGTRQKGRTYFTERVRSASFHDDVDTTYYEAWRLRSDGWIQTRIIATWPATESRGQTSATTEHRGSAFRNWRLFSSRGAATPVDLERVLERLNAAIVKQS